MDHTLQMGFDALKSFTLEIYKQDRDKKYAIRLLVIDTDKKRKVKDRTFYAESENTLALKFMLHIVKEKAMRRIKSGKHKIRLMETTTHQIPYQFLAQLNSKLDVNIFMNNGDKVDDVC